MLQQNPHPTGVGKEARDWHLKKRLAGIKSLHRAIHVAQILAEFFQQMQKNLIILVKLNWREKWTLQDPSTAAHSNTAWAAHASGETTQWPAR